MEMHLYNAAKSLKIDKSYKAFFIDLKIPVSTLSNEKLDEKMISHLSVLFRNFKINNKSTLWLSPTADLPVKSTATEINQESDIVEPSKSGLDGSTPDKSTMTKNFKASPAQQNTISQQVKLQLVSPPPSQEASKYCRMDYSLYEVEGSIVDFFQNINQFTLYFLSTGDLDIVAETSPEDPCIDIYLMLGLKKIVITDSGYKDIISEAVVKAITSKLRSAFSAPIQKILYSASLKLNGPLMYNTISRCLPQASSIFDCVVLSNQTSSEYYQKTLLELSSTIDCQYLIECLLGHIPNMIELKSPNNADRRLLLFKMSDVNVVFIVEGKQLKDILAYQIDALHDKPVSQAEIDHILGKSLMLLMAALWSDL